MTTISNNEGEKSEGLISLLVITILADICIAIVFYGLITELFDHENESTQVMIYSICHAVTVAVVVLILLKRRDMSCLSMEISFLKMLLMVMMGIICSVAISIFFAGIAAIINIEEAENTPGIGSFILLRLVGEGLAPAVSEELVFRGVIFAVARKKLSFLWSAIIVSSLFGVSHGISLLTVITFAGGFLLCYVYEKTGNILVPIAIHWGNNI